MGVSALEPDRVVIAAVVAGDADAFGILVNRYRDTYARYAVRILGSPDDADDALQSAFVRAFRGLKNCDPNRFGGWFYQIVINECRTLATRRGRRERRFSYEEADLVAVPSPESGGGIGAGEEIQRALDTLVPDQREAFVLKYVEELSYEEMAALTGVGVSALKMRVKRACEKLQSLLEGVHHE
jgi:RNA polymerase sigma-70 factor, ECF subfamily